MATTTMKRGFTTWANFRMQEQEVQFTNIFVQLFKDKNMKKFIETLTGDPMKKLQTWDKLTVAQMVTRIEWIVDQLKDYGILQNAFYCEFPALGRGALDETEWFLRSLIKADLFRVYELTIEYLETPSKLLTDPFSTKFSLVEEEPAPTKNKKSFFSKSQEDIEEEHRRKIEEKAQWRAKLRPISVCTDLLSRYMNKTKEGRKITYLSSNSLADLKDTRVLLTFVNSIFDDIFTPEIMLNDKWSVNLALESLCNLFRISSDFDSEDLVTTDKYAVCAFLACIFNKALQFKQMEKVLKRMNTLEEKLTVYHKDLNEMGEISMSANESRHKKELLLKVEVLKKEKERLCAAYPISKYEEWHMAAMAERLRVHALVAYKLRQRFTTIEITRPIIISNLTDSQYVNLSLTNGAAFYTSKLRETVSPNRRIILYDKAKDEFIEDFSGYRDKTLPSARTLLQIPENDISDIISGTYEKQYEIYYESMTRNRTLKPGQAFLYQLFPGSQIFLQKVYHKCVKVGDLLTVKKLVAFYKKSQEFIDSQDILTGNTALHIAIKNSHFPVVLYLLEQEARIEIPNSKGKTPFFIGAERFDRQVCKLLIEWGADIFTKDSYQKSALDMMNNDKFRQFITSHYQFIRETCIKVTNGDIETLNKVVLDHKYKLVQLSTLRSRCFDGLTAMHVAAKFGAIPIVELLIEMGVGCNIRDRNGATPLHHVHDVAVTQTLIESGANVNAKDFKQDTPMHYLCSNRAGDSESQIDVAELLANYGASLCSINSIGYMPIHYCAIEGRADYIMLLMKGDEQGMRDGLAGLENTPSLTYLAIMYYQVRCAVWLLGIDMGLAEGEAIELMYKILKKTDLSTNKKMEIAKLLLERGADPDVILDEVAGDSLLHITARNENMLEILKLLLENGANVHVKNKLGQTPLFAAVKAHNIYAAKILIDEGAVTEVKDQTNRTPFQHLTDYGEWISRNVLEAPEENLLKECSLNAERSLVRNISNKMKGDEDKRRSKRKGVI